MNRGHIPIRKCVACNQKKAKSEFIRIVKTPPVSLDSGKREVIIDRSGKSEGRGAYICREIKCIQSAQRGRRLERCLSCKVERDVYELLEEMVRESGG